MYDRTRLLLGEEGLERLRRSRVAVVGLGGVGSAAAEQLCRAGVGCLTLIDFDPVRESNLNRQLLALHSTLGLPKAEVAAARMSDINPDCAVEARVAFVGDDTVSRLGLEGHDYVLDCIDSLNPKARLIHHCARNGIRLITSGGAAAKTDFSGVHVTDLFATTHCPLARHLRRRLRNLGVRGGITAVHSNVKPRKCSAPEPEEEGFERGRRRTPLGSISYMPVLFGCVMAGQVVRELLGEAQALTPVLD